MGDVQGGSDNRSEETPHAGDIFRQSGILDRQSSQAPYRCFLSGMIFLS